MNLKKELAQEEKSLNRVIKIDEVRIHSHLDEMVRDTVEDTLNKLLDTEADRLCNAQRYEHTDTRSRHSYRFLGSAVVRLADEHSEPFLIRIPLCSATLRLRLRQVFILAAQQKNNLPKTKKQLLTTY